MLNIFPKNVFKGTHADGTPFRIEEWDYGTLSQIEFFRNIFMLIFGILVSFFVGPIMCIGAFLNQTDYRNYGNLFVILFCSYFLIDAHNGWLGLSVLNIFFSEDIINLLLAINVGCIIVSATLFLIGPYMYAWIFEHGNPSTPEYEELEEREKESAKTTGIIRTCMYFLFFVILFSLGLLIAVSNTNKTTGWVQTRLEIDKDSK